jgi:hypothetical protein
MKNLMIIAAMLSLAAVAVAQTGAAGSSGWLLDRAETDAPTLHRAALQQADVGGGFGGGGYSGVDHSGLLKPILLSALVPGLGEASMGYKRGYAMIALDIASWIGVKHYHDQGAQKRDDYIDYANVHWSETRLAGAFGDNFNEFAGSYYYGSTMGDSSDYETLSLWVSKEDDFREYYENLGKWDQFVFGWDDFTDPRLWAGPSATTADLKDDPRVSEHRIAFRDMRAASNEAYDNRDKLVYLNMATRIFSIFQVAYLGGVFSDGYASAFEVSGHPVALIAEPRGLTSSRLGVAISY